MAKQKRKVERESPEVGAAARRMVRGLVRRAAAGDTEALEELARLERELPIAITVAGKLMAAGTHMVRGQHYSYTELGDVLGITRQAARQRFSRPPSVASAYYYAGLPIVPLTAGVLNSDDSYTYPKADHDV